MEHIHNPSGTTPLREYFKAIADISSNNHDKWLDFLDAIMLVSAATSINLLKKMRSADIDLALTTCNLSQGYKHALCEFLSERGGEPFVFPGDASRRKEVKKKVFKKKYESQQDRSSLGNELGVAEVAKIAFPPGLFHDIKCASGVPMKAKGRHGTEAVANRVWCWAVGKWGNLHVDITFCDKIASLLHNIWPNLKPWGGKDRDWSTIIRNRFNNAREATEKAYKSCSIPKIDMSSPAKRLLQDEDLTFRVDDDAPSMYDLGRVAMESEDAAQATPDVVDGVPVSDPIQTNAGANPGRGANLFDSGVRIARGVAVSSTAPDVATRYNSAAGASWTAHCADSSDEDSDDEPLLAHRAAAPSATTSTAAAAADAHDSSDEDVPLLNRISPAAAPTAHRTPSKVDSPQNCAPTANAKPNPRPKARPAPSDAAAHAPPKKRRIVSKPSPSSFADSDLASEWSPLSGEEARAIGNNVTDPSGLGDPSLRVAKLFPLKDGKYDWFLATINTKLKLKYFFWVKFVEDLTEYRIHFYPRKYDQEWCFVRAKSSADV
jgi:hypothetical protein